MIHEEIKGIEGETKFKCSVCGVLTSGRKPKNGDSSFMYPRRHLHNGKECPGSFEEAEWVTQFSINNQK